MRKKNKVQQSIFLSNCDFVYYFEDQFSSYNCSSHYCNLKYTFLTVNGFLKKLKTSLHMIDLFNSFEFLPVGHGNIFHKHPSPKKKTANANQIQIDNNKPN